MVKDFLKTAAVSLVLFFGILMVLGFFNAGYQGMLNTLTVPFNWIVILAVILATFAYKRYRQSTDGNAPET